MRTLTAPGVEWREIDRSQYSPSMTGTACYVPVFTKKGEPYKCMEFTSRSAWTNYYGEPTNEAERYGYAAICEILNQGGRCYTARLPYDNTSFEKMVGVEYSVKQETLDGVPSDFSLLSSVDAEINKVATIECNKTPISYDLAKIDEYRTQESKVGLNKILIVNTTGSTYGKVTEDYRKGDQRELIGIIPVVTTAANAMYAQQLIQLNLNQISSYEPISGQLVQTLSNLTEGLKQTDLSKRFNTQGKYDLQKCNFQTYSLSGVAPSEVEVGESLGAWCSTIDKFVKDYHIALDYDLTTLAGIVKFNNDLDTKYKQQIDDDDAVSDVKTALNNTINAITENITWVVFDGETEISTFSDDVFAELTSVYANNSTRLQFVDSNYVNPNTLNIDTLQGSFVSATSKVSPEWHGVDGDDSIPETMSLNAGNYFSTIQPASDGEGLDPEHLKDIGVVVYKTYLDPAEGNKVSYEAVEAYCGSLYEKDVDPNTGVTKFIDTIINSQSQYINFFSNCFSTKSTEKWYKEECDTMISLPSQCATLGFYESMTKDDISISKSILDGLNKSFEKVTDLNLLDIDIVCDAGLANIASYLKAIFNDKGPYDLNITDDLGNSMLGLWTCKKATDPCVKMWKTVEQKLDTFCKKTRKDCMFIADGLRPLVIQGQKKIVRDTKPTNTIDANILPYFPAICGLNTNYGAGYVDWFETADDYTGDFFWCPPSIKAMGVYINTDINYNYWDAPAGLNRGMIAATDVAFSPTPKQAGCFYEKNWNYAINYPQDGIVLEGQKTFQVKPSAFDRVNVRRLFLRLERACYKVARYFVYEGMTAYTRQRLVDAIDPYFKAAKAGGGIYDYKIQCDEGNNTPQTIDNNECHVRIGIKPTKTIEFICFDFIAGSTGASWEEIMG